MTQEEKAKAYDEALKVIKKCVPDENGFITIYPQEIFPELKKNGDENADEKVRKALIKLVTSHASMDLFIEYDIHLDEALSWLEKKGEQNLIKIPKFKSGDTIEFNGLGHNRYTIKDVCGTSHYINTNNARMDMSYTDANFELVKQKPNKCMHSKDNYTDEDRLILCDGCEEDCKLKQKPVEMIQWKGDNLKEVIGFTGKSDRFDEWFKTWEEYEKYVHEHNNILKLFDEEGSHYEVPIGAWIVKTPDGHNVPTIFTFKQRSVKWSKEDEEILNTILNHFEVDVQCTKDDDIIKWLKSLKERMKGE